MTRAGDFVEQFRVSRPALCAALASLAIYFVARLITSPTMVDLQVYRVEGDAIRRGIDLYGVLPTPNGLRATYPPFAAILFVPLTLLSWPALQVLMTLANFALLFVVAWQSCRLAGLPAERQASAALLLAAVAIWAEPVFTTFRYGQINLLLLALVLWDFLRPSTAVTRGVGIGVATALKITPGLFVIYLLMTRRFRTAAIAVGAFATTVLISALVAPAATLKFWTHLLYDSHRVGRLENAANQSVRGWVVRISHTRDPHPAWVLLSVAALLVGLACAGHAYRRLGDRWGVPACAVAGLLGAPISWSHHWVWCVPIAVVLWHEARWWFPTVAIFWTFAVWFVPHTPRPPRELHLAPWQTAVSAWYVLFGAFFLGLTFARARRLTSDATLATVASMTRGRA